MRERSGTGARGLRRSRFWLTAWVTAALVLAAGTLLPWFAMAIERDDVEASESPLLLAVARQLTHGPRELYGPYGAGNPLVLIHPPLYYRLAALCAWPIARAGIDVETAARIAGRTLSLLGWMATLAGAFVLARVPSAPRNAGWWAILLAAATPVYGGLPLEVRPDLIGVALQTWGVVLIFAAPLRNGRPDKLKILLAFAFFALAGCIKQHLVVTPGVAFFLLIGARTAGRPGWKTIAGALLARGTHSVVVLRIRGVVNGRTDVSFDAGCEGSRCHPSVDVAKRRGFHAGLVLEMRRADSRAGGCGGRRSLAQRRPLATRADDDRRCTHRSRGGVDHWPSLRGYPLDQPVDRTRIGCHDGMLHADRRRRSPSCLAGRRNRSCACPLPGG